MTNPNPNITRWLRFLRWFCPPHLYEGIEGDLLEELESDVKTMGEVEAFRRFKTNILKFFRPSIILRNYFRFSLINTIMLRNYFTIAWRNLAKNKIFSAINIVGLSIGLATCLLIFQFVSFEFSYDTFFDKYDRIYRVTNDRFQNGKLIQHGTIMYPTIGPTMAKDYPEIEEYTRLMPGGDLDVKVDDKIFRGDQYHFVDNNFLSVFNFGWIAGERSTALRDRYSIVLTKSTAKKWFAVKDDELESVLGRAVYEPQDSTPYTITGVCADVPANSTIQFDALISYSTLISPEHHDADDSWTWSDMRHYLVLKPGADYKALEAKFPAFSDRYFQGNKVSGSVEKFYLQPLSRAHLFSDYEYDIAKRTSGKAVWAMLIAAIFILVIAWINYINLTTSRAIERAREVGLRKVMGALKLQLIKQFLFESILVSGLAFGIAILMVGLLQTPFNDLIGDHLSLQRVFAALSPRALVILVTTMVGAVLLSGFYPAFVLSGYRPVTVLKGRFQRSSGGQWLRKSLVVFQFMASATLITCALVVSSQLKFINHADLGINLNRTLVIQSPERTSWDSTFIGRIESMKQELMKNPGVEAVATSGRLPGTRLGRTFDIHLTKSTSVEHYTMSEFPVDHDFFDVYKIPILAGRKFLPEDHHVNFDDIHNIIMNRNAIELLGIKTPQDAIGQQVTFWGRDWTIIGVADNFHQESLRAPMEPIFFYPTYSNWADISVRLSSDRYQQLIPVIQKTYQSYFPDNAFDYFFIDDRYQQQYKDDNRFARVIGIFTGLAVIISCLGLVGLASYTASQRTKEIGIRKVLGASLASIVSLLSKDFVRLVMIAALLALPIAWYSMRYWLASYAYRIDLGWLMFVLPLLIIVLIAFFTISFQVLRAAVANPAETLKYE